MIKSILLLIIIIILSFPVLAREDKVRLIEGQEGLHAFYLGDKYCSKIVRGKWDEECEKAYEYHKYGRMADLMIKIIDDFIWYVREDNREKVMETLAGKDISSPEDNSESVKVFSNKAELIANYDQIITPEFRKYLQKTEKPHMRFYKKKHRLFTDSIYGYSRSFLKDGLITIEIYDDNNEIHEFFENDIFVWKKGNALPIFKDKIYLSMRATCAEDTEDTQIILDHLTHLSRCKNYKVEIDLTKEEEK